MMNDFPAGNKLPIRQDGEFICFYRLTREISRMGVNKPGGYSFPVDFPRGIWYNFSYHS